MQKDKKKKKPKTFYLKLSLKKLNLNLNEELKKNFLVQIFVKILNFSEFSYLKENNMK